MEESDSPLSNAQVVIEKYLLRYWEPFQKIASKLENAEKINVLWFSQK